MIDLLKKTVYAGIGATLVTKSQVESVLGDLVEKGKLSADEAREAAERMGNESKAEYEEARASMNKLFDELLDRSPVVQKSDFSALEKRVQQLEKEVESLKTDNGDA